MRYYFLRTQFRGKTLAFQAKSESSTLSVRLAAALSAVPGLPTIKKPMDVMYLAALASRADTFRFAVMLLQRSPTVAITTDIIVKLPVPVTNWIAVVYSSFVK